MAIVHIISFEDSSGRGSGGAAGRDDQSSSPSFVSSSYLKRTEREGGLEPWSPIYGEERVINGVALDLLQGKVGIDNDGRNLRVAGRPFEDTSGHCMKLGFTYPIMVLKGTYNGIMSLLAHRKTSFFSSTKQKGGSNLRSQDPCSASSSHVTTTARSRPLISQPTSRATVQVEVLHPTSVVNLEQSFSAAIAMVVPLVEKKRKTKEREKSSSKRSRREGSVPRPISGTIFDVEFHVSHRVNFHKNSSQLAMLEPLFERDITNTALELSTQAAKLTWYLCEFADRRGAEDVQAELNKEKKAFANLRAQLEALTAAHEGCEKQQADWRLKLDEVRRELAKTVEKLWATQVRGDHAVEECGKLKVEVTSRERKENELVN
ncbi:hypothetical protein LR48_Vigan02g096300 [Vigna angularis]|uniref:Uncharacterized protein n=1 Tax=Phaseolus angularis TaxID=3914 RepID=A0A0L9TW46_PHAAN|nr:hypothetical protein LR48_Vigan02g096300 [Vigna angularis]